MKHVYKVQIAVVTVVMLMIGFAQAKNAANAAREAAEASRISASSGCGEGGTAPKGYICHNGVLQARPTDPGDKEPRNRARATPVSSSAPAARRGAGGSDAVSECKAAGAAIAGSCSSSSVNATADSFTQQTSQSGQQMSQQQNTQASEACRQANQNAQQASSSLNSIKSQCQSAISSCNQKCSAVTGASLTAAQRAEVEAARAQCGQGPSLLAALETRQQSVSSTQQRSQQCMNDAGGGMQMPQMPQQQDQQQQAKLPDDCTNPTFAASNPVCQCLASGGSAEGCRRESLASTPNIGDEATGQSLADSGGGGYGGGGQDGTGGSGSSSEPRIQAFNMQGDSSLSMQGGKGANEAGLARRDTSSKINTGINAGAIRGSAGFAAASASVGPGAGTYSPMGAWIPPKLGDAPSVDVEKFRPKMTRDDLRLPASNVARDQVYASHVNMWRQINLRYQAVKESLKP